MFIQYASGNLSYNGMKKNKEKMITVFIIESSKRSYLE